MKRIVRYSKGHFSLMWREDRQCYLPYLEIVVPQCQNDDCRADHTQTIGLFGLKSVEFDRNGFTPTRVETATTIYVQVKA